MRVSILFLLIMLLFGCKEEETCTTSCGDEKIKAWYKKRYGEPITEFELSATKIDFRSLKGYVFPRPNRKRYEQEEKISLTKTATSVFVVWTVMVNENSPNFYLKGQLDAELDMRVWLDFVRGLRILVSGWKKEYENPLYNPRYESEKWFLNIHSAKDEQNKFRGVESYPENWDDFKTLLYNIKKKLVEKDSLMKEEFNDKLSAMYYERFGESITSEELSSTEVYFNLGTRAPYSSKTIRVVRNVMDTNARLFLSKYGKTDKDDKQLETELTMGEWFDFVRTLRKNNVYKNQVRCKETYNPKWDNEWSLRINHLKVDPLLYFYEENDEIVYSHCEDVYPSNWNEIMKIMDNTEAKIKEKAGK